MTSHKSKTGILADYCDGKQFAEHLLYKYEPLALQIFFYNDDVEVANPLGSSATLHKLSKCPVYPINITILTCMSGIPHSAFVNARFGMP